MPEKKCPICKESQAVDGIYLFGKREDDKPIYFLMSGICSLDCLGKALDNTDNWKSE